ncbi:TPA: AAA family ATPase [Vibrio parahaemolyticus]|nr:AAA family ATPase [Vibrio parahaemolyticus]HCE2339528.1 AAA family ATPase [Vibrio parahaemolyticus]HCE4649663.1 AAA family ATPase [Vibrio parahaemolyticus]HCG8286686.1 AAA family ATPase [Vibrio parahaemolyticus]HCG8291875.1 AAA family ATPase [Vibrio parahaemolyticus]
MKLTEVKVDKLFGIFNHQIKFKTEENITIVIGENGLGKTVILEALDAFFNGQYSFFYNIDFDSFSFCFDNDYVWLLTKKSNKNNSLDIALYKRGEPLTSTPKKYTLPSDDNDAEKYNLRMASRKRALLELEFDHRYSRELLERSPELYNELMLELHDPKYFFTTRKRKKNDNMPKWFEDNINNINVKLIETQRLITLDRNNKKSHKLQSSVSIYSEDLKSKIEAARKESSEVTLQLDSSYPNRLIEKIRKGSSESFEDLNDALQNLDRRRKFISSTGIVVNSNDSELTQIKEEQKDLVNTLKLYIDDSHKKLDPYDSLAEKIDLFRKIINKRFKHKELVVSEKDGMVFESSIISDKSGKAQIIPQSKLSSGEQNELILFYKLIFNTEDGDLILIDEPELSLHISWQNKFINDLKEVTSLTDVSIVIATHSPDIIDENWHLKVQLKGVE